MKKLFGTDGMRGEAGVFPLDAKTIEIAGWSLARQLHEKLGRTPRFITGRDTRVSGSWIEKAFHTGALAAGAHCESAAVITTPGVAFLTAHFDFDAGVVVSASHNPFHDNGLKIFSPSGEKIDESTERMIEKDILESDGAGIESRGDEVETLKAGEYQNAYLDYLAGGFDDLRLDNFKIVVDCANGASSKLAPRLFARFGAQAIAIHDQPNGRNINDNCGSTHIESLMTEVRAEKADFGVAYDGDADRALFVDEKGNLVDGDATLWAMAQLLQSHGNLNNNTVVATVMSNIGLEVALKSRNINLVRTAVGDKYVLQSLLETNASVGGEQSGHIIFPQKSLVGDGILTTLFLLEALFETGKTLSEITDGFFRFPQTLVNVRVKEKRPFEEIEAIVEGSRKVETALGGQGRLLLRYSGTENLARVMIEGQHQEEIERQAHWLAGVISDALN
jgi:phosphoglucosamine mutase